MFSKLDVQSLLNAKDAIFIIIDNPNNSTAAPKAIQRFAFI
jgi:hypothetical protein